MDMGCPEHPAMYNYGGSGGQREQDPKGPDCTKFQRRTEHYHLLKINVTDRPLLRRSQLTRD